MSVSNVLIVDDSTAACLFMANALQKAGYQTRTVLDGHHGLSLVSTLRPHCLIVDVVLPGGINGYGICRQVRAMDPHHTLPIILVSIKNSPFDSSYGLSLGADRYLSKPFTEEALTRTVWDVLPERYRPALPPSPPIHTNTFRFENLIPRICENAAMLATSNPYAIYARMDRPTRQLLSRIDGHRTVGMLLQTSGLDVQHMRGLLKVLYEKELIEFTNQEGHLLTTSPFSSF